MSLPRDMVRLGVITGAHGIKGEVKLTSFTADPSAISGYGALVTSNGEKVEIERLKPRQSGFIAAIKGVRDRNRAEALKGTELWAPGDRLPKLKAGEVYVRDLIGTEARRKDGSRLGEIIDVANFGAGDLLEVRIEGRGETVLVPFADPFVPEFDVAGGIVVVDLPEGYVDESE